jgi:hypothetical protein
MFCLDDVPVSVKNGHLRFRDVCQGILSTWLLSSRLVVSTIWFLYFDLWSFDYE